MPFEMFKKIVDEIGVFLIHIDFCNWGEPLLNEEIFHMIKYAKNFCIHAKLDTNFNICDDKRAENLINSGLDKIILSIDGASQQTYEKYRRGGDFERVLKNVQLLVKKREESNGKKPEIEWQFLVFRHNEHEIEKAKEMAHNMGVDDINFTPPYVGSIEWLASIEPFRSKYYEISGEKMEFKKSGREEICNWLWDGITINSNGSISPCCSVEDAKDDFFSTFPDKSFDEIWNSERFIDARKHVVNDKDRRMENSDNICFRCDHIGWSNHMNVKWMVEKIEQDLKNAA